MDTQNEIKGQGQQAHSVKVITRKEGGMGKKFFFSVLIAIVAYSAYMAYKYFTKPAANSVASSASSDRTSVNPTVLSFFGDSYYGVFLDNNDVYFGKIKKRDASFITLENTFYLRVTKVQQKDKNGKIVDVPSLNIINLKAELHKPTGEIELQIGKIISIQELDPASEVVKIINNYKAPSPNQTQQ